jgi:hypothetical protein
MATNTEKTQASGGGGNSQAAKSDNKTAGQQTGGGESNNQSIGETVSGATDTIKDALGQAKEKGGAVASQAYGFATQKATEAIEDKKANLTEGLSSVAETIRQIGENLTGSAEPTGVSNIAAQYTNTAADKVEQLTGYLERRDFKGLVRDLEDLAHKNPAIFLGGAFALGILAARFFKSGTKSFSLSGGSANQNSSSGGNGGGTRVRQLRRKSTGKADTLRADEITSTGATTENTGG